MPTYTGTPITTENDRTLYRAMLDIAEIVSAPYRGKSTSAGSATMLIDATRKQNDDFFNLGPIFFETGTLAGLVATVTDYANASGQFIFETQSAAPGSGIQYVAFKNDHTVEDLKAAVNAALREAGQYIQTNQTLESVSNQEEYELPAGVYNIRRVDVAQSTADPYNWQQKYRWDERPGKLVFHPGYAPSADGYPIRITYRARHAELVNATDLVDTQVNPMWLKYAGSVHALRERAARANLWAMLNPLITEMTGRMQREQLFSGPVDMPIVKLAR